MTSCVQCFCIKGICCEIENNSTGFVLSVFYCPTHLKILCYILIYVSMILNKSIYKLITFSKYYIKILQILLLTSKLTFILLYSQWSIQGCTLIGLCEQIFKDKRMFPIVKVISIIYISQWSPIWSCRSWFKLRGWPPTNKTRHRVMGKKSIS